MQPPTVRRRDRPRSLGAQDTRHPTPDTRHPVFTSDQSELIDFGDGRKLERFGSYVLDRPCPAADRASRSRPSLWSSADSCYRRTDGENGSWSAEGGLPESWMIRHGELQFQLKPTPFGHVGVFPEQVENWDWITSQVKRSARSPKVLNLFAHTGGATLAAAAAGAEVAHIDAATNVVAWARENAKLSGLEDAPVRWIVEDAVKFVRREVRRGNAYDAVILDPPSYGHGPKGEVWKTERHLMSLLSWCGKLTAKRRAFILVTCHTPSLGPAELEAYLADAVFGDCQSGARAYPLGIRSADGRTLPSGIVARWPG